MRLFSNFQKLHTGLKRAFIAGTFIIFIIGVNLPYKYGNPETTISMLAIYWAVVLLFSWVYIGFKQPEVVSNTENIIEKSNRPSDSITAFLITIVISFIIGIVFVSVYFYNKKDNTSNNVLNNYAAHNIIYDSSESVFTKVIDVKDSSENPFKYRPK